MKNHQICIRATWQTCLFCTSRVNVLRGDTFSLLTDEQAEVPETHGHGRKWNSRDIITRWRQLGGFHHSDHWCVWGSQRRCGGGDGSIMWWWWWCSARGRTGAPQKTDGIKRKEHDVEILRQHFRTSARKLKVGHKSIWGQQKLKEPDLNRTHVDRYKGLRTDV